MKIAIVCDDLIQFGGAERIFLTVCDMYPEATVYTSVVSKEWEKILEAKNIKYEVSFMQKLPFIEKLNRYYSVFLLHILAFESFDFSKYDVVLSMSSRYAHFIITKPQTKHICYMHTPGRMFWEPNDYFENEEYGILSPLKKLGDTFVKFPSFYIRQLDYVASERIDRLIANSEVSKKRIKKYYKKDVSIIHPFVEFDLFEETKFERKDYFLVLTRLVSWKKVDIAIKACNNLKLPLKVVGDGPDLSRLKKTAGKTVEVLGYISDEMKNELFSNCRAFINTQFEDFGITSLEAMACGKPVIAYGYGGVRETVIAEKTGEFFYEQNENSLEKILKNFDSTKYSSRACRNQARKYAKNIFVRKLAKAINDVYLSS